MSLYYHSKKLINGQNTDLPEETEELISRILNFVEPMINLSIIDVKQLDIQTAEVNHLKHRFNRNNKTAERNIYIYQ
jgi:hypothetical protein